jgi:hypothetical protein
MRHRRFHGLLRMCLLAAAVGTVLPAGCGSLGQAVANFNPCGTILNCDPVQYNFIRSGYKGPGADPDVDPSCTYPPYCTGDPFVSTQTTGG